jgi:hypothetical protein
VSEPGWTVVSGLFGRLTHLRASRTIILVSWAVFVISKTQSVDYYKQVELKDNAINIPLNCNKQGSYKRYRLSTEGAFDAKICATACRQHNKYALEHRPQTGKFPL